jgi:hypothetical protein
MNIKPNVVILITIATLAIGCYTEPSPEPGPLERASSSKPTLTSTVTAAPKPASKEYKQPDSEPEVDETLYEPTLQSDDGITIHRLITAPEVEGREPLAASSVFGHHEEKVYAFLDVSNESSEAKTVTVFFVGPSGKVSGGAELDVPANVPRWRTWAYTRFADEAGLWRIEVRSAAGVLLAALPFEVAEGC